MNWKDFWNEFPLKFQKESFLQQVGKTYQGKPITEEQLKCIIEDIVERLLLNANDLVLDLCCGNGLISYKIAHLCKNLVGIDFSQPLIDIAKTNHLSPNLVYHCLSVLDIDNEILIGKQLFTKIYMYEALQHFQENQLNPLLNKLIEISDKNVIILLSSILDAERIRSFYNTDELFFDYKKRKENGDLLLGTWWQKEFIIKTCNDLELKCDFFKQPDILHTAHYRFDVQITRK